MSIGEDLLEARLLRRLEDQFEAKFDLLNQEIERLNGDKKLLKADNKIINERMDQLIEKDKVLNAAKETAKKQEISIRNVLNKQRENHKGVIETGLYVISFLFME